MKKGNFFKRLMCVMLIMAVLAGYALPGYATGSNGKSGISFQRVDNSMVSASLTPSGKTEITPKEFEYESTDIVRVSIVLSKPSTIEAGFAVEGIAQNDAAMSYRDALKNEQIDMVQRIETAINDELDVAWHLTLAANLISADVQYGQIRTIEMLPGVKCVILENEYVAHETQEGQNVTNMATSSSQIGSNKAWEAGYTGAGTRVAVIDTGTDTNHQSLNNSAFEYSLSLLAEKAGMTYEEYIATLDLLDAEEIAAVAAELNATIDPATAYINTKLPYGYNYKDKDYDITHDNDEEGAHGSHVAGIAVANAWLSAGNGTFGKALDYCFMQGVAPDAQLLTLKVFGKAGGPTDGDYMAALEDAIVLGADVVNMSLGSVMPGRGHHLNPVYQKIMDDLAKTGVVVSISAGNSGAWVEEAENGGYLYATDASMNTTGQPGSFTNSLCIASVENDGMVGYYLTVNGSIFIYNEDTREGQFTNTPFREIAGEYEYIFIDGVGKAEDWEAVKDVLPGKIALCSRGETNFSEKARLAVEAGAIAVLVYNNTNGIINLDLTDYTYTAPVAALTMNQGQGIRKLSTPVTDENGNVLYLTGTMTISDKIGMGQFQSDYYVMSDFSSWGVPGSLEMKPEITAPGGNIFSLDGMEPSGGGYVIQSGTSMAAPQVTGMAALLAQYIRENNLVAKTGLTERQLAQSLLMSTATPVLASEGVYFPVLQQGAGLANIYAAMTADSYIMMAEGTNAGAADGKVKVELYDDPDRTGSYSATFTVYNMQDVEKLLNLNADFFIQAPISDGTHMYMDYSTARIPMNVVWTVNGQVIEPANMEGMDFNGDGKVNADDGQTLLDYATGVTTLIRNEEKADLDGDGDIDSYDAYTFLKTLASGSVVLPADGSAEITVDFTIGEEMKKTMDFYYPNGTYLQGFLYAETMGADGEVGTSHSIPVLGFFGNWSDPSMFDVGEWTTFATEEDTRIPYVGRTRGNDFKVRYANDPGYNYSFGGNPLIPDEYYMPERNAMNSKDTLDGISFIAIRHADQSRVLIKNETTGETMMDQKTGAVNMAYFYGAMGWQNSGLFLETRMPMSSASEGDRISMSFSLASEYYVDENGNVDWDSLGRGTSLSTSFIIDNTAPELLDISISVMDNTMTVRASDNQYVAAVGLYNKTGTRCLASTGAHTDIEKGEAADYTFSLDKVNGKKFLLQVFDYAMNATTYMIEMQIGEESDLPPMMAYDLVSHHWAGFDKNFEYDYKVGTPRIAFSDYEFYAATIADHYVFASTYKGELYVMPEDDLTDTTFIVDMDMVLTDMAYCADDGEIYAVNDKNQLVSIHKLTGDVTRIGDIGVRTNTLAVSPEGVFYCNELGTGKIYSFTLATMDEPVLVAHDPELETADMGGTTGMQSMEYDPNTGKICWNSHCEYWGYITYAYFYEIDPVTGEMTRYADFWHEMTCLMIPVKAGGDKNWASPTDEVIGVKLNKTSANIIKGTTIQIAANVQPWTAVDRTVTWSSADETIATVDENGVITGIKPGTTTIRATSNLDPTMYAECVVTVETLNVTINGTVTDVDSNTMFYSWNMATDETWTAGAALDYVMTSATFSTAEDAFYMMDAGGNAFSMYYVEADGTISAEAKNPNGIALWDMAYSEYFSELRGMDQVSSIYYYYLLSPKNPMDLDAVGFDLGDMAGYLVGITSMGYEEMADEDGNLHDTEHLVLLDNDGYIWDFWIYDRDDGGMDALYDITKSDLALEFLGDENMDNMFTSLMVGEDGNLYLSSFNGTTNEIYHISYDTDLEYYRAVKIADMGEGVWPATITSVTMNNPEGISEGNAVKHPMPTKTMTATKISQEELATASVRTKKDEFSVTQEEMMAKIGTMANDMDLVPNSDMNMTNMITVNVTNKVDATNGVVKVTWDSSKLKLTNAIINGNYISKLEADGSLTFGYVALDGITAGNDVAKLTFELIGDTNTVVTIEHKQINNEAGETETLSVNCKHENTELRGQKDATCTENGYTGDKHCADCGALVEKGQVIKATGHDFSNGNCSGCGMAPGEQNPNTGDNTAKLIVALLSISVTGLVVLVVGRKKLLA